MTSMEVDTLTGELVPEQHSQTLFRTDDPAEVLAAARRVAEALGPALSEGNMIQRIGHSEHVKIEGWQTCGSMVGIVPHTVWSRPLHDGKGWESRAEARTLDGRVVGAAEAMVTRDEPNWRRSPEYAIRSMAQTRAQSKALSGPLRFIVTLSGRNGTPAEEVLENESAFGSPASKAELAGLDRALTALLPNEQQLEELEAQLLDDAGGYVPKVVARALMRVARIAAHRPAAEDSSTEDGEAGAEGSAAEDTPPTGPEPDPGPDEGTPPPTT